MLRFSFAFLASLVLVAMPLMLAHAQTGLVGGVPDKIVPCDGPNCNLCSLVTLIQNVLNFLIYLAVIGAALLFAWAGWLYLSSAEAVEQRKRANKLFWNVAIGLVVMIGAWLFVDTLMKGVLNADLSEPWSKICPRG